MKVYDWKKHEDHELLLNIWGKTFATTGTDEASASTDCAYESSVQGEFSHWDSGKDNESVQDYALQAY